MNYLDPKEIVKLEKTKEFLGRLLDDSMEATCTDFQHSHVRYFVEILGIKNIPQCLIGVPEEEPPWLMDDLEGKDD